MRDAGLAPASPAHLLDPGSCALLVLDMQRYFLEPESHAFVPSSPAIIDTVNRLKTLFIARGRPVIVTRHGNREQGNTMMRRWWRDTILLDQDRAAISPLLDAAGCTVLDKEEYDAFYRTPLETLLHDTGTRQIVVTGVMTHLCCETTARSGFVHGFEVFFPADATATFSARFHRASLINLAHGFAHICLAADLCEVLA
ncbi:cysteine hydrolase [bacterium]|nr:cysteine hydrolase [bacterium]